MDYNILDNLMEGFQLIGYDWRYLYINDAVVRHSRYRSKKDLLGYTMMERYPGIEQTELFDVLRHCMNNRTPAIMNNQFTFPDGSTGWFELRIYPVPEGVFILSMDITQRKESEQERKKYTDGLEEMIQMASHRVRQPVSNILGLATLLDGTTISIEELKEICGHMKASAILLDTFTKELTYFIRDLKK